MRLGLADPTPTPNPNQVKPAWGLCYDAAKTAGAALAAQLRARGCGARPASLLGVSYKTLLQKIRGCGLEP